MNERDSIQRWSTDDVPPAQRFDYWSCVLSEAVVPMRVDSTARHTFSAEITATTLGPLVAIRDRGRAHESFRSRHEIRRSADRSYHLLVNRSSPWFMNHCGAVRLSPGDLVLADSRFEHHIRIAHRYDIVNLKLPVDWLHTWLARPEEFIGQRIPGNSGWGLALSSFVTRLIPSAIADSSLSRLDLSAQVGVLLAAVFAGACQNPSGARTLHVEDPGS